MKDLISIKHVLKNLKKEIPNHFGKKVFKNTPHTVQS